MGVLLVGKEGVKIFGFFDKKEQEMKDTYSLFVPFYHGINSCLMNNMFFSYRGFMAETAALLAYCQRW